MTIGWSKRKFELDSPLSLLKISRLYFEAGIIISYPYLRMYEIIFVYELFRRYEKN